VSATGELVAERAERDVAAVEAIMRRGGPRLALRMMRVESRLQDVSAEVGAPLASYATAALLTGGKRLRPLLVLLAAEAVGGDGPPGGLALAGDPLPAGPAADGVVANGTGVHTATDGRTLGGAAADGIDTALVRAASAVELLHSATLVHDDLIDGARLRRGHPTVAVMAGPRAATATGDLLFSRAFAELARNGAVAQLRSLSDASSALAAGELLQREDAFAADISMERYLERCEMKTAALFEAACRLGALVAGESDRGAAAGALADALGTFARRIGLAFQLLDDVLDISGPAADTGKSRGTDLLEGTITLPLILARQCDPELAALDLRTLRNDREAEALCDRIAATGVLSEARSLALDLVRDAKEGLPAGLAPARAALLELVADAVVDRYR
jgi:geranylgeranyl pyrophosphate synthase